MGTKANGAFFYYAAKEPRTRTPRRRKTLCQDGITTRGPRTTWTKRGQEIWQPHEHMHIHNTIAGLDVQGKAAEIFFFEDAAQRLPRRSSPRNGPRPQRPWTLADSVLWVAPVPDGLQADLLASPQLKQSDALPGQAQELLEQEEGLEHIHIAHDKVRSGFSAEESGHPRPTWTTAQSEDITASKEHSSYQNSRLRHTAIYVEGEELLQSEEAVGLVDSHPAAYRPTHEWVIAQINCLLDQQLPG